MDQDLLQEPKISSWMNKITAGGCSIRNIEPLSIYRKPGGELLFALLKTDITAPDGTTLPPIIFIRGHACIIVPLLKNRDTGDERFLMVRQRRIAAGALTLEFPAGMLDNNLDNPASTALKELEEETGLTITEEMLFPLHYKPFYSSAGASDECIYYFGCVVELDYADFSSFEGRTTGTHTEHEHIQVTLKTRAEAEKQVTSIQARVALYLFDSCNLPGNTAGAGETA